MNLTFDQKIALALSSDATAEELELLADYKYYYVRSWVVRHPNCPISLIEKLADDENSYVRSWVTRHPNCPQYLKEYIRIKNFVRSYESNN